MSVCCVLQPTSWDAETMASVLVAKCSPQNSTLGVTRELVEMQTSGPHLDPISEILHFGKSLGSPMHITV